MRLLRVIATMDPASGGPCQGIRNIVPTLEEMGVCNEVVSLDDPNAAFLGSDPFPIHALGPSKGMWNYSPKLRPWLNENLDRFDAVIIHGLWLYISYATSKAVRHFRNNVSPRGRSGQLKLFVMPHGMLDPYFQRAPGRRLKAIRNWFYWKLIEGNVVNKADGIFFTCEEELLLAREPFRPYLPQRELNVKYGIENPPDHSWEMREAFLRRCPQVHDKPYILFLSRIHEKKGVDLLIKSYLNVAQDDSPKLVIAGPGMDTPYGEELKRLVEQSNRKNAIFFPGMLKGKEKWGAFYGSEAFILPSHQENFGIAVVEALACGKPVLISNQVNIWREIERSGGCLVAEDTLKGTEYMLKKWFDMSGNTKQIMSKYARRSFEKHFHVMPAAQKMLEAVTG